jgi:hypothetical protein
VAPRDLDLHADFARQLEHVAAVATFSAKLTTLEGQFSAARAAQKAGWTDLQERLITAKRVTMAAALAVAFLQYYFLDVSVQILAMRPVVLTAYAGA